MNATRAVLVLPCLAVLACVDGSADPPVAESQTSPSDLSVQAAALRQVAVQHFAPLASAAIPASAPETARFTLGRKLFFDARLSVDAQVACATCHLAAYGGGDGLVKSVGVMGRVNPRNAPTVLNAGLQNLQRWRGDRDSLADQAARALLGPDSFGNADEAEALERLDDAGYASDFERAFPGESRAVSLVNFGEAIAVFERTLRTPGRFDAFLKGDDGALDARELAGLALFMDLGCVDCHAGPGVGGEQLAKFGVLEPYADVTGTDMPDAGRFDVTHDEADRFVFKVPLLRNVAQTAPYFHDGSALGLEQAVRVMAQVQLGQQLREHEVRDLVAFLGALSGAIPGWFSEPNR